MFRCLYCGDRKSNSESSLEHAIPQFLGGAAAPQYFMLKNVCKTCNINLGMFVDASYARSRLISQRLALAARKLYTDFNNNPLPLICMGIIKNMSGLVVPDGMVAEHWLGPSGESIIWIRSHRKDLECYVGGSPIDKKKKASTLYFLPTSSETNIRFRMGIEAFEEAFRNAKKARRIFGAEFIGEHAGKLIRGFSMPTKDDRANVEAIRKAIQTGPIEEGVIINIRFDHRFICKMVLGVGYSLFGEPFLGTETAKQARLGLWPKQDQKAHLRGVGSFGAIDDPVFSKLSGYPSAVAIMVSRTHQRYAISMSVDQQMPFITELAPDTLSSPHIPHDDGYILLLFPQLRRSIVLELSAMLAHMTRDKIHAELAQIDEITKQAEIFNAKLPPLPDQIPSTASNLL
jgi:hypothetical protein